MQGAGASPVLSLSPSSPSFSSYSSANLAEIAARVVEEFRQQEPEDSEDIFNINWVREEEDDTRESNFDDDVELFSQKQKHKEEEEEEEEFEFAVVCNKKQEWSSITADEIFFNGQIKPLYPLFNRDLLFHNYDHQNNAAPAPAPAPSPAPSSTTTTGRSSNRLPLGKLMSEERETSVSYSCSSSEADDLDNLPPGTYCVWTPKPSKKESQSPGRSCKKSHSTGSSKRWKFRDLLYRSNSDGKDTFVFFTPLVSSNHNNKKTATAAAAAAAHHHHRDIKDSDKSSSASATGTGKAANKATVQERYARNRSVKEEDKKRSFLPYRQDLVGFFSNVN